MTRFVKISEEVLGRLPVRLVGRYAWLAMSADFATGEVRAASWSELAALMRCTESAARRSVAAMADAEVVEGEPPGLTLCVRTNARVNARPNARVNANTPSYREDQNSQRREPSVLKLWGDFVEGRRGKRPTTVDQAPRKFAEVVRASSLPMDELRTLCRLAGESYADWGGAVNYENAFDRGLEAMSRNAEQAMSNEEWLKS